jgi:hypothetical protein
MKRKSPGADAGAPQTVTTNGRDILKNGSKVNSADDDTAAELVDDVERHLARCRRLRRNEGRPPLPKVARGYSTGRLQSWKPGESEHSNRRDERARHNQMCEHPQHSRYGCSVVLGAAFA